MGSPPGGIPDPQCPHGAQRCPHECHQRAGTRTGPRGVPAASPLAGSRRLPLPAAPLAPGATPPLWGPPPKGPQVSPGTHLCPWKRPQAGGGTPGAALPPSWPRTHVTWGTGAGLCPPPAPTHAPQDPTCPPFAPLTPPGPNLPPRALLMPPGSPSCPPGPSFPPQPRPVSADWLSVLSICPSAASHWLVRGWDLWVPLGTPGDTPGT